ncbi:eukaryotic translation initiation factor 4 gamma 2 [Leptidea sinapis]|uniref:eukaryotic translation initiation factor 4 gamma 2 n=1 Tax=Leptidea sinapis TaxID=189913 RepID=UPI0021C33F10|nr:eukaryotic translation initiation factor 4 gamma 2 [Leptidea sinapis]
MYAQLCKRLSEEAPNFEPPGQPCTFKLLLLNKCRAEFENRAQAFAAFEDKVLSGEEEEKRHISKCKMLGNIKFIGELGKLEILAESILHRCIQNLLARRAAAEHHEDLECLAQLVRTCGRVLDSERGRGLMDQYFARIETLSTSRELAPRIRFMLRDVVELRRSGWMPRTAVSAEGPVPIHQLRPDQSPPARRERERDGLFRGGLRSRPLDDVLAGLSLQNAAPLVSAPDKLFGNGFPRDAFRQRSAPSYFPRSHYKQGGGGGGGNVNGGGRAGGGGKARAVAAGGLENVQMRPAANSLMFSAATARAARTAAPPTAAPALPTFPPPLIHIHRQEPAITIKAAPDKKDKPKKDKGMNKEEACRLAIEAVTELATAEADADAETAVDGEGEAEMADERSEAVRRLRALELPDKLLRRVVAAVLEHALGAPADGPGQPAAAALAAAACRVVRAVKRAPAADAVRALLAHQVPADRLAQLLAHAVLHKLVSLAELGAWCEGGAHHPLLLDALAALRDAAGAERLRQLFADSKLDLCALVPSTDLQALDARGLAVLAPALHARARLATQLAADPAPQALWGWVRGEVEAAVRGSGAFVSALVGLVADHVTAAAGGAPEREAQLLAGYAALLVALTDRRPDLQLAAVYAAQMHAHKHRYPKGMLLRWFMYLYNLEVCEEDAFLRWREDVTDAYPGKGEALFQVNAWLTWLQQQESEDEEVEE